jgi:hypothetical protein
MTRPLTPEESKAFMANPVRAASNLKRGDARKANMHYVLVDISRRLNLEFRQEFQFHPERKWRADYALLGEWQGKKVAILVEYDGTGFAKTGHTQTAGFTKDARKRNAALILGYVPFHYTCDSYQDLSGDLKEYFKNLNPGTGTTEQ